MLDTIEERIDRILQEKRELFETIFSGAEGRGKLGLTQDELFGLFSLAGRGCETGGVNFGVMRRSYRDSSRMRSVRGADV